MFTIFKRGRSAKSGRRAGEPDQKVYPIMSIFPIDLFGRGRDKSNYPEIIDLKVNTKSGVYDVIVVTN